MLPFIPQNTRDDRSNNRDGFSFPQSLPTVSHNPWSNQPSIPVYDPKMFEMGNNYVNQPNDRLMQSSQIYQNIPKQHDHFMPKQQPIVDMGGLRTTRERRDERMERNMDRMFLSQRDYWQETNERVNGFSIVPRDTRYDNSKKTEQNAPQMRETRTIGCPYGKIE